ncbi:hypothetical protein [Nocardia carnea]|uniref:hypothetical protein n=1 Tax=Nocardia carnea TaxID=37328 RepID=UPI002455DEDD|nr:hypothetical protein [Nocardia carnea]
MPIWVVGCTPVIAPTDLRRQDSTRHAVRETIDDDRARIRIDGTEDAVILARQMTQLMIRDGEHSARREPDTDAAIADQGKAARFREGADLFDDLLVLILHAITHQRKVGYSVQWSTGIATYFAAPADPTDTCNDLVCRHTHARTSRPPR